MDQKLDQVLFRWSQAISALCKTGLAFTQGTYEAERYEEILKIAVDIELAARRLADNTEAPKWGENINKTIGALFESDNPAYVENILEADHSELLSKLLSEVKSGVPGYVTPKVAVGAVVENDNKELLLIKRSDSGVWLYPTGWTEVGYSPAEVVAKEVKEETGICVEPIKPIAILDGMRMGFNRVPLYSIVFHCRATGGILKMHPLECLDVGWFPKNRLLDPLAGGGSWTDLAFSAIEGSHDKVYFDPVRADIWDKG
jgi:ADP-ribose pyrophosphatase YjhB (NUDIX family)